MPRRTIECDEELEKHGLYEEERIKQIVIDLIPLEEDVLSLEMNDNFAHYLLGDDDTYKVNVLNSINRLESVFGQIKHKYAKGDDSVQILKRLKDSAPIGDGHSAQDPEIDCLMLIDRNIDLVSPFCVN